jgi:beta-glucosidase
LLDRHRLVAADDTAPITVRYTEGPEFDGEIVAIEHRPDSRLVWFGNLPESVDARNWAAEVSAVFRADVTGTYTVGLTCTGRARLFVDDRLVIDAWSVTPDRGQSFFGLGSVEITADVDFVAGSEHHLRAEYAPEPRTLPGLQFGVQPPLRDDAVDRARRAAGAADLALVFVGTTAEWETEGHDRTSMELPGGQDDLVAAVVAAQPRTAVIAVAGAPILMDWSDAAGAVLWSYFGGIEMADAIADVITGVADPGGRLPTTFPNRFEDHPALCSYPGEGGVMLYGEGVFMGYRGYDRRDTDVRFCFGHGLSYAEAVWIDAHLDDPTALQVTLRNPSERAATEVVQAYVSGPDGSRWLRAPQQLAGFAKVQMAPGERVTVAVTLQGRAFEIWDPEQDAWVIEPGTYTVRVGRSSRDLRFTLPTPPP